jgi:hypothetical protein
MHRTSLFLIATLLGLASFGCGSEDAPAPESAPAVAPATAAEPTPAPEPTVAEPTPTAPTGIVPGSHEDWCGEHEVPESLCTRCNPTLIAAFKATGDWCAEHNLPESQCKICNPNLRIERPAATAGQ